MCGVDREILGSTRRSVKRPGVILKFPRLMGAEHGNSAATFARTEWREPTPGTTLYIAIRNRLAMEWAPVCRPRAFASHPWFDPVTGLTR